MGIPLLAGRTFVRTDDASAPLVAIVNDTFARRAWPGADPIGKRIQRVDAGRELHEIVGVVTTSTYGIPGELPQDAVYFPFLQQRPGEMVLLVQTAGESAAVLEPVRDLVRRLDRDVPLSDVQTIETFYDTRVTTFGTHMVRLVGGMGVMGVLLTMVGLYGLVSYAVSRRTREIGIRIAIGATSARIVRMILRQGMAPAWAGLAAGLLLSVALSRLMSGLVPFFGYRVSAQTYSVVVPLLIAISLAASFTAGETGGRRRSDDRPPRRVASVVLSVRQLRQVSKSRGTGSSTFAQGECP